MKSELVQHRNEKILKCMLMLHFSGESQILQKKRILSIFAHFFDNEKKRESNMCIAQKNRFDYLIQTKYWQLSFNSITLEPNRDKCLNNTIDCPIFVLHSFHLFVYQLALLDL